MTLKAGDRIGTFKVTGELGTDGMDVGLRARDTMLDGE
jgi:hypothetical protein|tara:strand:- start:536 stop:649 length:114 start_codon:yes stop_codon:yes gene_type:complete